MYFDVEEGISTVTLSPTSLSSHMTATATQSSSQRMAESTHRLLIEVHLFQGGGAAAVWWQGQQWRSSRGTVVAVAAWWGGEAAVQRWGQQRRGGGGSNGEPQ